MARTAYFAPGVYVEEVPSARQPIAAVGTNTVGFIGIIPDQIYYPVPNPDYDPVTARGALQLERLRAERARLAASTQPGSQQQEDVEARIEEASAGLQARADSLQAEINELNARLPTEEQDQAAANDALTAADEAFRAVDTAMRALPRDERDQSRADVAEKKAALNAAKGAQTRAADRATETRTRRDSRVEELSGVQARLNAPAPPSPAPQPAPGQPATGQPAAGQPAAGRPAAGQGAPVELEDETFDDREPAADLLAKSVLRPYTLATFEIKTAALDTKLCTNFTEYASRFGPFSAFEATPYPEGPITDLSQYRPIHPGHHALTQAVDGFFRNGGSKAFVVRIKSIDQLKDALAAFESIDDIALISAAGLPRNAVVWEQVMSYCEGHENVFGILDSPQVVNDGASNDLDIEQLLYETPNNVLPRTCKNAAYYFPHIEVIDPAKQLQDSDPARQVGVKYQGRTYVAPSGHVAGIYARTDTERGVHKAPANAGVRGAVDLKYYISKPKQEILNPIGVNCIRNINGNIAVWGARCVGGDRLGEWKYISVRRLFLFLQESIDEGTQWVVFEPNDQALWGKIKLNVSAFLTNVWRSGALFGATPEEAFYVKCDEETNPVEVRDAGQVITEVGVAIVRPAEFVIFRLTQSTGARPS